MKTLFTYFLFFLIALSSCRTGSVDTTNEFVLKGKIKGLDSGKIVLFYASNNSWIHDTTKIKNGKFKFKGKIIEPTSAILNGGDELNSAWIYLDRSNMKIFLSKDCYKEFKMTGSKTESEYDLLCKNKKPFYDKIALLKDKKNRLIDSLKKINDDSSKLLLDIKEKEIDIICSLTQKRIDSIDTKFVLENPKSFLAIIQLRSLGSRNALSLDSLKSIFNNMDSSLKKSSYAKDITEDIRKKDNIRIGAQAPNFKATGFDQQTLTLSQFKGNSVVLLDFWASWCSPCLKSLPHLKTIYKKYHSKGFEIISVSTDDNRNAWIEAIKTNSLNQWYNILIAEKWPNGPITNDDIFQNYPNTAIPEQIIIEKNGFIVYHHVGYSKESEESLDRLLSGLFND